jgi:aminotransferase EvaB
MIAYFDYRPEYDRIKREIDDAIARVLQSGRLILGPEVRAFENEFAAYVGASGAVGVNSGTDALTLALRALGVGSGDEVITVANAGVPPIAAIRALGALPRFVDVEAQTLLIDPEGLQAALTERTRCVLPVHLYGQSAALEPIVDFAERHGLPVVEDCAQGHGALYHDRHVGTHGTIGCFSFYPTKNLGAYGDGGMCVTMDRDLEERVRSLRMYGFDDERRPRIEGVNSRLDELQAAILRVKLAHLEESIATRAGLAKHYLDGLREGPFVLPRPAPQLRHAYHLFVIRAPERRRVTAALEQEGIGYGIHYAEPVHLMPTYAFLGYETGDLPVTEAACASVVSLPLYPGLGSSTVDRVVETLLGAA